MSYYVNKITHITNRLTQKHLKKIHDTQFAFNSKYDINEPPIYGGGATHSQLVD